MASNRHRRRLLAGACVLMGAVLPAAVAGPAAARARREAGPPSADAADRDGRRLQRQRHPRHVDALQRQPRRHGLRGLPRRHARREGRLHGLRREAHVVHARPLHGVGVRQGRQPVRALGARPPEGLHPAAHRADRPAGHERSEPAPPTSDSAPPATSDPGASDPGTTDPGTTDPGTTDPPPPPPPPPGDTTAPTQPGNLHTTATTTSSVSLTWDASSDAVGVTGYTVSRDGVDVATVSGLAITIDGLACGTSSTVGVRAVDAAGNASAAATLAAATVACPPADGTASVFLVAERQRRQPVHRGRALPHLRPRLPRGRARARSSSSRPAPTARRRIARRRDARPRLDDVVIRPAAGASVTTRLAAPSTAATSPLRGFTVNGSWTTNDADRRRDVPQPRPSTAASSSTRRRTSRVVGGSVGGTVDTHPQFASWPVGTHIENILVDGVYLPRHPPLQRRGPRRVPADRRRRRRDRSATRPS